MYLLHLGRRLYLKIALRVGSAMLPVTESNSLYLKIFRFCTIFEKKLCRVSAVSDSAFNISPFSLTLILSFMDYLSKSKGFTNFQNSLLSVTYLSFHSILSQLFAKEIHSDSFAYYNTQKLKLTLRPLELTVFIGVKCFYSFLFIFVFLILPWNERDGHLFNITFFQNVDAIIADCILMRLWIHSYFLMSDNFFKFNLSVA